MLRNLGRGLAALVALALLLAGLPAALAVGTLAVTRQGGPQQTGLVDLLTKPDNGNLFLWALVVVGWIAWLCFAASVLVEIPAQLRGRNARRVFALGWSQRMAGGLVGAVLALLPTAGAALAVTPAAATTTAGAHAPVVAAAAPTTLGTTTAVGVPGQVRQSDQPTYRVREERPAESLWSIAERTLGSGARWKEISRLNQGRTMDASGRRFDADRPIHPGWVLLMPADAVSTTPTPAAAPAAPAATGRGAQPESAAAGTGAAPAAAPQHVVVRTGDTLSAIARKDMGNGDKWPELFAANRGVRAPDGVRLEDPDLIEPGMVLTVPQAGGAGTPPVTTPPVTTPPVTTSPVSTPPATTPPHSAPPATTAPTHAPPVATHPAAPVPTHAAPSHPVSAAPTAVPTGNTPPTPAANPPHANASSSNALEEGALGGTALLAAVILGALAVRRAGRPRGPVQSRRSRPRPTPPSRSRAVAALPPGLLEPVPVAELEPEPEIVTTTGGGHSRFDDAGVAFLAALSARQDATGLDLLDRALRSLARTATDEGRRLPALTVVRITPAHTVELHLSTPAPPIAPFHAAHASTVWWCTPDSDELLPAAEAATVTAPYPALVSLGTAAEGSIVLVDLEAVRLVHLSGAPKAVTEVLRTLAMELAFTPLADEVTIHTVGVAEELESAAEGRLRVHDSLEDAVAAVSARDQEVRSALALAGATTPREARSRGTDGAAWAPEIVLCATVPDGTMPEELGRMLDASPRGSVAVVASAPPPGAGPMARWTLPATGNATLPGLGMSVELQHLSDHQYLQWLGLLGAALPAPDPADEDLIDADDLLEDTDSRPVAPVDPTSVPRGFAPRPHRYPDLDPVPALDPYPRPAPDSDARPYPDPYPRPAPDLDARPYADPYQRLAPDPDARPYPDPYQRPAPTPTPTPDPYGRLDPDLGSFPTPGPDPDPYPRPNADLDPHPEPDPYRRLAAELGAHPTPDPYSYPVPDPDSRPGARPDPQADPGSDPGSDLPPEPRPHARQDLAPALDPWAVRSPWPDPVGSALGGDPEDPAESVEAAHELTLRRLRAGDHQGAEAAAFAGLTPAPDTELLHRDLLCVYADAGATDQLHKAVNRLERIAARTGRPLEPETDALIAELRGTGGAA